MLTIVFGITAHISHLNASFGTARALKEKGHRIIYVGTVDFGKLITAEGFEFKLILEKIFTKPNREKPGTRIPLIGFFQRYLQEVKKSKKITRAFMKKDVLDSEIEELKPDLFIIDEQFISYVLLLHKYRIPVVIIESVFPGIRSILMPPLVSGIIPDGKRWNSFIIRLAWIKVLCKRFFVTKWKDLITFTNMMKNLKKTAAIHDFPFNEEFDPNRTFRFAFKSNPRLVLSPDALDFPHPQEPWPDNYYVGALVDFAREEKNVNWETIDTSKPLVYCALGTVVHGLIKRKYIYRFLKKLIAVFRQKPEYYFILATGKLKGPFLENMFPNVTTIPFAPQLEILKKASLMITHGGLNSIKECIMSDVPMLVFPMANDAFGNAARVVYHRLGLRGNYRKDSVEKIAGNIDRILKDTSYMENVKRMHEKFLETIKPDQVVEILESLCRNPAVVK